MEHRSNGRHPSPCWACMLAADLDKLSMYTRNAPFAPAIVTERGEWNVSFRNRRQHDADEAFQSVLHACDPRGDKITVFTGSLQTQLICGECGYRRTRYHPFGSLSLALPREGTTTLDALFASFCAVEHNLPDLLCRDEVNGRSVGCGCIGRTSKQHAILERSWPTALVVTLKRFAFNMGTMLYDKLATEICFGETWQVNDYVTYSLRCVLVHHGHFVNSPTLLGGKTCGHYTAYVRDDRDVWYHCNDNSAPRALPDSQEVLGAQAYMLFYVRQ